MENSHDWAESQRLLGLELLQGRALNRAEIVEEALALFRSTLKVWDETTSSQHWANAQISLGSAMAQRVCDDPSSNIEAAIEHYRSALRVWTRESAPYDWARTQLSLGHTLLARSCGNRDSNIEAAIEHYRNALTVWTKQSSPDSWADAQLGLAGALREYRIGSRVQSIEASIEHYHHALELAGPESTPSRWAHIQGELAQALVLRVIGGRMRNIDDAIAHFQTALEIWTAEGALQRWIDCSLQLARAYIVAAHLCVDGGCGSIVGEAITPFRFLSGGSESVRCVDVLNAALQVVDDTAHVLEKRAQPLQKLLQRRLQAEILFFLDRTEEASLAIESCLEFLQYVQTVYLARLVECNSLAEEWTAIYDLMVAINLRHGDMPAALEACEKGRAAVLLLKLNDGIDIAKYINDSDRESFTKALNKVRGLQYQLNHAQGDPRIDYEEIKQAHLKAEQDLHAIVNDASKQHKKAIGNAVLQLESIKKTDEILNYLSTHKAMALYFFVTYDFGDSPSERCRKELHMLCIWKDEMHLYSSDVIIEAEEDQEAAFMFCNPPIGFEDAESREDRLDTEQECMARLGTLVGDAIQELAYEDMPDTVLIVPHSSIASLPFSALPIASYPAAMNDELPDQILGNVARGGVSTAPTLSLCVHASLNEKDDYIVQNSQVFSVTCESHPMALKLDEIVLSTFGNFIDVQRLEAQESELKTITALQNFDLLHINAYGVYAGAGPTGNTKVRSIDKPYNTGLLLRSNFNKEQEGCHLLSITDIWKLNVTKGRLVVILASRGAVEGVTATCEDWNSISCAFLLAGVQNVVSTLWPVHDVCLLLVMTRFYNNLRNFLCSDNDTGTTSIAWCLFEAQNWFRYLNPEEYKQVLEEAGITALQDVPDNTEFSNWAAFSIGGVLPSG